MTATAQVYRLRPHPFLDVAIRVIREMDPAAVIVIEPEATL